ncbi:hypothetical protein FOQG_12498 [Fusarium oxysporum f. sp. raphani 54005]|uniref:Uncharacterized protein n=4 Tax=Fusarium oxysporum TaxID=5507 RepID=X0BMS2_FUSOX|nr:hypothetical protein FOVG_13096 [Fusarium oxysporum f. sp. pisi HDV247]EXK83146.1 hypothetical protein FOQG_12498 [Fusarium oxysporum f. sp. raphani 54005]EXL77342.1 hypothetical protein FOPG_08109 [Fusarium oxysporum f. sp. conglutinans race 2 54008]EXM16174.1 hypothetical protein FOTG_15468 [Fusarium oxysporum f. sp. vasinfectum 25433]
MYDSKTSDHIASQEISPSEETMTKTAQSQSKLQGTSSIDSGGPRLVNLG